MLHASWSIDANCHLCVGYCAWVFKYGSKLCYTGVSNAFERIVHQVCWQLHFLQCAQERLSSHLSIEPMTNLSRVSKATDSTVGWKISCMKLVLSSETKFFVGWDSTAQQPYGSHKFHSPLMSTSKTKFFVGWDSMAQQPFGLHLFHSPSLVWTKTVTSLVVYTQLPGQLIVLITIALRRQWHWLLSQMMKMMAMATKIIFAKPTTQKSSEVSTYSFRKRGLLKSYCMARQSLTTLSKNSHMEEVINIH